MSSADRYTVSRKPLQQTEVPPVASRLLDDGTLFLDFGQDAFGTLIVPAGNSNTIIVHLGEQLDGQGRVERAPAGTIRYQRLEQKVVTDQSATRIVIPPDERNTGLGAIKMPAEIGEVFPFRYAEIENAQGIDGAECLQVMVHYPFNDDASSFHSSNKILNAVWDLCKYSIKATTFCGVYVDGDRERIPYEGDAYINQLGHYCVDSEYAIARYTHEYMLLHPTWPTEWQLHSVMIAWMDYLYTGETDSLEEFYDDLCVKTLSDLAREDGLISTESELCTRELEERLHFHNENYIFGHGLRDLVDWPPGSFTEGGQGERDNHEMLPINTVVNAFHCHALKLMSQIAAALGKPEDEVRFAQQAERVQASINRILFDASRGVYLDGEGSEHASLHSNMFMLAFDLVPEERLESVVSFVKSRGMACSVYGAQHLLDALYLNNEADCAMELMTATHDRGWWNMIQAGSTITLEAWDLKYKNNLDWNHAWGAAPANIIPRYVLGVRPLTPGFDKVLIKPQPGSLEHAEGKVPTPHGPIEIAYETVDGAISQLTVEVPSPLNAELEIAVGNRQTPTVTVDGKSLSQVALENDYLPLALAPGKYVITCQ